MGTPGRKTPEYLFLYNVENTVKRNAKTLSLFRSSGLQVGTLSPVHFRIRSTCEAREWDAKAPLNDDSRREPELMEELAKETTGTQLVWQTSASGQSMNDMKIGFIGEQSCRLSWFESNIMSCEERHVFDKGWLNTCDTRKWLFALSIFIAQINF